MTSLKYMSFVEKNLASETVEQIISVVLMTLSGLISNYTPIQMVSESKQRIFNTLMKMLSKGDEIPKTPVVDQLFAFVSCEEHLKICIEWLDAGSIKLSDQSIELATKNKHSILVQMFRSRSIPYDQKMAKLTQIMADD